MTLDVTLAFVDFKDIVYGVVFILCEMLMSVFGHYLNKK